MAPYLETVKVSEIYCHQAELKYLYRKSFADVPITDAGVDTLAFLEAADGLKVRARYYAGPNLSVTLEQLVENEKPEKKRTATEGLLWLLRGLSFTCKALQNSQANKTEELAAAFTKSYEATLKKFHNFVVKGIFAVAMKACPYRADFYNKLAADPSGGQPASQEQLDQKLDRWLTALDGIVTRVEAFYEKGGYGKGF
ncbi:hypothetical protein C0992_005624 [Termitomyces sp. T32_za158]|nr:hypothetical protein C0992_005624 [Termitomyces sp. T32_za158]